MAETTHKQIPFNTIIEEETRLADLDGKALLIVNVASECGDTPQYKGLETIYQKDKDRGLVVVGFPSNNFGSQQPGTDEQIMEFCKSRFDVTFPMMSKVSVKGDDKHPLFVYLTEKRPLTPAISNGIFPSFCSMPMVTWWRDTVQTSILNQKN